MYFYEPTFMSKISQGQISNLESCMHLNPIVFACVRFAFANPSWRAIFFPINSSCLGRTYGDREVTEADGKKQLNPKKQELHCSIPPHFVPHVQRDLRMENLFYCLKFGSYQESLTLIVHYLPWYFFNTTLRTNCAHQYVAFWRCFTLDFNLIECSSSEQ